MRTKFTVDLKDIYDKIKGALKKVNTYISLSAIAAVIIAFILMTYVINPIFFPQSLNGGRSVRNVGKLSLGEGIGIYWDVTATQTVSEIDWGVISLASGPFTELTFQAYDADYAREASITINGVEVFTYPPANTPANNNAWVEVTVNITDNVDIGGNTILFAQKWGSSTWHVSNITIEHNADMIYENYNSYKISGVDEAVDPGQTFEDSFVVPQEPSYDGTGWKQVYIRNEGDEAFTAGMYTSDWNPGNLTDYADLSWNFGDVPLAPSRVRKVTFILKFDINLPKGFDAFEFLITVTGNT
jgi:hypothetical protein